MNAGVYLMCDFHSTLLLYALRNFNIAPTCDGERGIRTMRPVDREPGKYMTSNTALGKILCPLY
jgi:hypothetical protein